MLEQSLATRRKFLSHAIDHVFGEKIIKDRACADLYANLLGIESNNKLISLLRSQNAKIISKVYSDWSCYDNGVFLVFQKYLPGITGDQVYQLDELSKPSWASANGLWLNRLVNLLKHVEDITQLRHHFDSELCDEIAYLLISLADGQLHNNKAKNRLLVICSILMHLKRDGKILALRWSDIATLYQTDYYTKLLVELDIVTNHITDRSAVNEIYRYSNKELHALENYNTAIPEFNQVFKKLGVLSFSQLSTDVEKLLFG
ncbi:hypothetical protein M2404_004085 [Rheinheimera pacifica]|uniref:hypothetical protein n=1 Tax=Rheinheimera pacifica TaxID=173990 RepID=UPI0021682C2A|nr:hypothetical protein [Rheinheimera pacifica]MCS4309708.1 hypothetical protein [Rheinheimera pacifica]